MNDQIRQIAERISRRIEEESAGEKQSNHLNHLSSDVDYKSSIELDNLRKTLNELQQRLANIETHLGHTDQSKLVAITRSPWARNDEKVSHPSQQRFGISEAVSELVDYFEREKICEMEPGGKPCDHCGMCSARGF
jgi:predicted  nucleic acid-binding Zn-ribbon protein